MGKQIISQNYYICSTNEKGRRSLMYGAEAKAGFIAAGLLDMMNADVIELNKKKITVKSSLPKELKPLSVLYDYISSKPRTTSKVMEHFCMSTEKQINQLIADIGESLLTINAVSKAKGGLLGNKDIYIPDENFKSELLLIMKTEIMDEISNLSGEMLSLIYILQQTKTLHQYLSKYEYDIIKTKLKEIRNNPDNKMIKDLVSYLDDITAMFVVYTTLIST